MMHFSAQGSNIRACACAHRSHMCNHPIPFTDRLPEVDTDSGARSFVMSVIMLLLSCLTVSNNNHPGHGGTALAHHITGSDTRTIRVRRPFICLSVVGPSSSPLNITIVDSHQQPCVKLLFSCTSFVNQVLLTCDRNKCALLSTDWRQQRR